MSSTSWEDGIIAKLDALLLDRFPITPRFARAASTSLVSSALHNAVLPDKYGPVCPNLWFIHLARSGEYKTPVMNIIRNIARKFRPEIVAPSKFTPEGFTEYIIGTNRKDPPVLPHPANFIIRDEVSQLIGEINTQRLNLLLEYLSQLWDGEIEGYYTRSCGYEGGVKTYASFFGVGTNYFLQKLNESFFTQGLGNRILWSIGDADVSRIKKHDPYDFFLGPFLYREDTELKSLTDEIVTKLRRLEDIHNVIILLDAAEIWANKDFEIRYKAGLQKDREGSFLMKQSLNILKLSAVYAASRMCLDPNGVLLVTSEDMQRAIEDTNDYLISWGVAMKLWRSGSGVKEIQVESMMRELDRFIEVAYTNGGVITIPMVIRTLKVTGKEKIAQILQDGVDAGYFELAHFGTEERCTLTETELTIVKPKFGRIPATWRLTDAGKQRFKGESS